MNSFCMIRKDLLLIGGINMIYIINVNKYKQINQIEIPNGGWIYGTCMLNHNIIITGDSNGSLIKWKIEEDNLIEIYKKENAHDNSIYIILNLNNEHIVTGSDDITIKIW